MNFSVLQKSQVLRRDIGNSGVTGSLAAMEGPRTSHPSGATPKL